ncbi:TBC1 domain, member 5 [Mortierella sp. GBA30]|nr:TBC1 domain, member 5 [Mortierella sp. GBA30]
MAYRFLYVLHMRRCDREKWAEVFEDPHLTIESLKARAVSQHSNLGVDGIRSVCWRVFLSCLPSLELSTWTYAITKERERYMDLRKQYIRAVGSNEGAEPDLDVNNPLSLAEDSPWQQFFVDSELKKIIKQDVERTLPDNDYFRSERVQEQLSDILFIYCKINHDVSYRQGMHELLAHVLWVVSSESLDIHSEPDLTSDTTSDVMKSVMDSNFIEHDTFSLFSSLMSRAKPWYEFSDEGFTARKSKPTNVHHTQLFGRAEVPEQPAGKQTPVIEWSTKIFHYLERIDNELYLHLKSLQIEPQLFGIRWFRLLFGREFPMDEALSLWDGIFAKDPSLNICIFIGVALLLRIRDELLEEDFAGCLHKLMRYPSVKDTHQFLPQALRLQKLPNTATGQEIIRQNYMLAGKPLPALPPSPVKSMHQQNEGEPSPYSERHSHSHNQHHHPQGHHRQHHQPHSLDQTKGQGLSFPGNGVLSQHLPPAALDAIKPVAEGFVHVTKNVLESKGGAALNKAIHDMKFQAQLGQIVAKALVILEAELVSSSKDFTDSSSNSNNFNVNNSANKPALTKERVKESSKATQAAISGLEHVRDILLGFSKEIDPLVIESGMLEGERRHISAPKDINTITQVTSNPQIEVSAVGVTPSAVQKLPPNAAPSGTSTPSNQVKKHNAMRSSLDFANDRRGLPRASSQPIVANVGSSSSNPNSIGHEIGSATAIPSSTAFGYSVSSASTPIPTMHTVSHTPPPAPSKPFSFDDLIKDSGPVDSTLRPSSPLSSGSRGAGSSTNKIKSPRSSLAHSQFSWMVEDGAAEDGDGGGGGIQTSLSSSSLSSVTKPGSSSGGATQGSRLSAEFSPSIGAGYRIKVDPLAGSISRRSGSGLGQSSTAGSGSGLGPGLPTVNSQFQEEDPLQT